MIPRRTVREIPVGKLQPEQSTRVSFEDAVATELNARVVEFIAKPEKTDELRGLLCQSVTPLLRDRTGRRAWSRSSACSAGLASLRTRSPQIAGLRERLRPKAPIVSCASP